EGRKVARQRLAAKVTGTRTLHEPFIRKQQRAAALQDASEGHVLPGFREVLDCASPLELWLPLQQGVHGPDARPILEVEAFHESEGRAPIPCACSLWWGEATDEPAREDARPTKRFMAPMRVPWLEVEASHEPQRAAGILPAEEARSC